MVAKREKIPYCDLEIFLEPVEEKPFYLTGESPSFRVVIENNTPNRRWGKIVLIWRLGDVHTIRILAFELDSSECGKYEIQREWLYCEGAARYDLIVMPKRPEDYADVADSRILQEPNLLRYLIHPLCSYYVRDKDLYRYEEDYRNDIKTYSLITIGLTIVNLVFLILARFFRN